MREKESETEGNVQVLSSEDGNDDEAVIREREKEEKLRERGHLYVYLSDLLMIRYLLRTIKKIDREGLTEDKRSVRGQTDVKIISGELIKIFSQNYTAWGDEEQR